MGHLVLVRHAQASFLAADYDRLSPLGEEQARLLGEYWGDRGVEFDRIFSGPRVRQRDTAKIAGAAYSRTDVEFPEPIVMDEFDEYDGERVLRTSLPQLAESDSLVRELHGAFVVLLGELVVGDEIRQLLLADRREVQTTLVLLDLGSQSLLIFREVGDFHSIGF